MTPHAHRWCVLALALVAVASPAWGQAVVVKDVLCGFPNLSNGDWIYNARGRSTIAPNGIRHLVCWARVPPPRVEIRVEGHSADARWIEGAFVPSWAEHISSSGKRPSNAGTLRGGDEGPPRLRVKRTFP